jgi:hypothetical protein
MTEVRNRVRFLSQQLTKDPIVLRLSDGLIDDCVFFAEALVSYINKMYTHLTDSSYMTTEQVWELVVGTITTIFEHLRKARSPIQDASETDPTMLLWGILKAHEVMKEYREADFENHPSLTGLLVQKMLQSSPVSTLSAQVASAERGASHASAVATQLQNRVKTLENRVTKLE